MELISHSLVNQIYTADGPDFNRQHYWDKFIEFLAAQAMFDSEQLKPLCDYLAQPEHMEEFRVKSANKQAERTYSFKGRTINSLLARMHAWHSQLQKARASRNRKWEHSTTISDYESPDTSWSIMQILTEKELLAEGRELKHCVYSYAGACMANKCTIWSLKVHNERKQTIEVREGQVTQIRGAYNSMPSNSEMHKITTWTTANRLSISSRY